ncbi:Mpv17-like protein 2 [Elysia marginata]|uniref:Mpv17-like protein 2 n=1 Tax=Elysia marginata TaxID=1093978 RepID=A0AAV4G5H0_9GAST|nr:Mpv17-like protein 2 [Elysia marginata]
MASYANELGPEHRMSVNVASAVLCVIVADVAHQVIYGIRKARQENGEWVYDFRRTARLVVVTFVLATIGYKWYNFLDETYVSSGAKSIAAKLVLDEVVMAPFVISSYIFALGLLEGQRPESVYTEWTQRFTPIYKADLLVWPAVQLVNVLVLPVVFRVHFINTCTFLWNVYLIHTKHCTATATGGSRDAVKPAGWDMEPRGDLELTARYMEKIRNSF